MDSQSEIKVGDIVCLKSGGPEMVVGDTSIPKHATCYWYSDSTLNQESSQFHVAALRLVKADQPVEVKSGFSALLQPLEKGIRAKALAVEIHTQAEGLAILVKEAQQMGLIVDVRTATGWEQLPSEFRLLVMNVLTPGSQDNIAVAIP